MNTGKGVLRFGKPFAGVICVAAATLAAGTVHADDEWTGANIVDNSLTGVDIRNHTVQSIDIRNGAIVGEDLANGAVDGTKVADESIGSADIATDAIGATEVQDNSIDAGEIVDFSLTNQDIGVLFAQISGAGVVDNSSGSVSVIKLGTGNYEVDFARNVSFCAFVATVGPSGAGSALGEVNVADRAGNANAVFVDTNNSDGSAADKPFHLIVVC